MTFTTDNGSVYTLDHKTMSWSRKSTDKSGRIRQEFGTLLSWPEVVIGYSVRLHDSKILPGHALHFVYTSHVVEVKE